MFGSSPFSILAPTQTRNWADERLGYVSLAKGQIVPRTFLIPWSPRPAGNAIRLATHILWTRRIIGKSATQPSATQGTPTGGPFGADRGQRAFWRGRQPKELTHDPKDQLRPIGNSELVVQALEVRVDGMRRDIEIRGDGELRPVVEYAAHDLEFTRGQL